MDSEIHEKSFRIKHEDERFFTRILSKESSKFQPSFRVYYGDVSGAVPFTWETIPGTPKHTSLGENSHIPPLTPPPSYHTNNTSSNNHMNSNKSSRSKPQLTLRSLIRRVIRPKKRVHVAAYPSSTSSSVSSLSWSYERSSFAGKRRSRRFYSWGSTFDHERAMDIDHHRSEDQMKRYESEKIHGGYYSSVKRALLSVLGRGSD